MMDVTAISGYLHKFYKVHVDYAKEDPFSAGILAASAVIFLAILPWGAKFWLRANGVLMLLTGFFCLLFPQRAVSMITANNGEGHDALHNQEFRCIGIIMLTIALALYLLRNSNDVTVHSSCLMTLTLFYGLSAIVDGNTVLNCGVDKKKINFNCHAMLGFLHISLAWFLASFVYTLKQQNWGGYTEVTTSSLNNHLRLDFVLWFVPGLLAFIFPKIICEFQIAVKMDPVHGYLARCMGLSFITIAMMSGRASNFLREEDKKTVLLSHVLACVILLGTMGLCQVFTEIFTPWHALFWMACMLLVGTMGLCQIFTDVFTPWHALFWMAVAGLAGLNAIMGCDPRKLAQKCMHCLQILVPSRKID